MKELGKVQEQKYPSGNRHPEKGAEPLGFYEIVPGDIENETESERHPDIPRFDLNRQSMAAHRRMATARRKGPGNRKAPAPAHDAAAPAWTPVSAISGLFSPRPDPLIVAIVRRDIQRLCRGEAVFT